MQNNPLWTYTLEVYGKVGVELILLQLQDDFGADINMLLCCYWMAAASREMTNEDLAGLIKASAKWRAQCIMPLRAVRRFLKSQQGVESIRERVKTLEVDTEQWQQAQMYRQLSSGNMRSSQQQVDALALQNLRRYGAHLPGVEWEDIAGLMSELVAVLTV
ncbi:MAG: TIGR02444 family protein [Pseudomonadales bacterium]